MKPTALITSTDLKFLLYLFMEIEKLKQSKHLDSVSQSALKPIHWHIPITHVYTHTRCQIKIICSFGEWQKPEKMQT